MFIFSLLEYRPNAANISMSLKLFPNGFEQKV